MTIETKLRGNFSESFKENIQKAAENMSDDQDEIKIPESGGQVLVRKGSKAEEKRSDLVGTAKCTPFSYKDKEFLVCVR